LKQATVIPLVELPSKSLFVFGARISRKRGWMNSQVEKTMSKLQSFDENI